MNGIIISKERHSIKENSQYQYVDTRSPLLKLYKFARSQQNFTNKDLTGPGFNFTIPHNLGYIPMFFLYADRDIGSIRKIVTSIDTLYPENTVLWTCYCDNKNINVTISGGASVTGAFGYNYFIFYNKVS